MSATWYGTPFSAQEFFAEIITAWMPKIEIGKTLREIQGQHQNRYQ